MEKERVIKHVEETIRLARNDLRKNGCTSDKIRQFTGLINSYTRLTQSETDGADDGKGDPNYYAEVMAE